VKLFSMFTKFTKFTRPADSQTEPEIPGAVPSV